MIRTQISVNEVMSVSRRFRHKRAMREIWLETERVYLMFERHRYQPKVLYKDWLELSGAYQHLQAEYLTRLITLPTQILPKLRDRIVYVTQKLSPSFTSLQLKVCTMSKSLDDFDLVYTHWRELDWGG